MLVSSSFFELARLQIAKNQGRKSLAYPELIQGKALNKAEQGIIRDVLYG